MHLFRTVVTWQGPQIKGNAATVLHWDGSNQTAPPSAAAIGGAWGPFLQRLPSGVQCTIPGFGDTIEDTTGSLVGTWSTGNPVTVNGSGPPAAAAGVGACITWTTGGIVTGVTGKGRRLRGRTFLVPLTSGCYDIDGTLTTATFADVQTFAANLMAAGPLAVWHRPTTKGGSNGTSYAVLSSKVRDHVAFLGSRRD